MASGEAATGAAAAAVQTFVLKVSIHCQGCKKKVRKVLKSVEGVHNVAVDGAQNKVTVTGTMDVDTLVRRLYKSGKQAVPWHPPAAAATKLEAAPEALPAPPAGDGGKDDAAADKKPEEQPVKEPQAESSEKKAEKEAAGSEKKPEAEKETESEKKAKKEEAKKDGDESEAPEPKAKGAEPSKEAAAVAAKETGNDEDEANKKKNKPKDAGEKEPAAAAAERSLSPAPAPAAKHAHEEYHPYYAPQPVLSYHTAQPSASVSYYAPRPEPAFSVQQPQPQPQPMHQWSPSYLYMPYQHTAPESYYHDYHSPPGTHTSPPPLQDSYRIFDDENPNSCSVM